jgi:chaperone BCS1
MEGFQNASVGVPSTGSLASTGIPVLDSYLSNSSIISHVSEYLHVDISTYLSLIFLLTTVGATLLVPIFDVAETLQSYFMSSVEVRMEDEMYTYLMYWISHQGVWQRSTRVVASTQIRQPYYWSDDSDSDDESDEESDLGSSDDFDVYWAKRMQMDKMKRLRITPAEGRHWFRYEGHWIRFTRRQDSTRRITWGPPPEQLYLTCLGRDQEVLKNLLRVAQRSFLDRDGNKTIIYRGQRDSNLDFDWIRCMARPARPLSTVVLDEAQKHDFLADVKEYLHPRTHRWYSNRGIPYRRGYMFYGPPGTGKSSLCFAVAGSLHLKIYLVSLNSKSLTEDGLASLFQRLPRRCIVLLEDVDTAGLTNTRDETAAPDARQVAANASSDSGDEKRKKADDKSPQGISLSALLNIIDGVASSEGRILVMTTNHIEQLDAALLRPGRVDMSIAFRFSDTTTTRNLFLSMYAPVEGDLPGALTATIPGASVDTTSRPSGPPRSQSHSPATSISSATSDSQLSLLDDSATIDPTSLAQQFADEIPSGEFTPAEIQGYLLRHKKEPEVAIAGAKAWIQGVRAEKAKKAAAVTKITQ